MSTKYDLLNAALVALRRGDLVTAGDVATHIGGSALAGELVDVLGSARVRQLMFEAPFLCRYLPLELERLLSDDGYDDRSQLNVLGQTLAHTVPSKSLKLATHDLELAKKRYLSEDRIAAYCDAAADALFGLAIHDPRRALAESEPWRKLELAPDTAETYATAALQWNPAESANVLLESFRGKARLLGQVASRIVTRWSREAGRVVPPDHLLPIFRIMTQPRFAVRQAVEPLLWASFDIPPTLLARLVDELAPDAAPAVRPFVSVCGALWPERLVEMLAALDDDHLQPLVPAAVCEQLLQPEGESPIACLGLAERFPVEAPSGHFRAALRRGDWQQCLETGPILSNAAGAVRLLRELANATWQERPSVARRALDLLIGRLRRGDEEMRKVALLEVIGLPELRPELADEVIAQLDHGHWALANLGFHVLAKGALFERVMQKIDPAAAAAMVDMILSTTGAVDERVERLLDVAADETEPAAAALRAVARIDPATAWDVARGGDPIDRPRLLVAVVEGEVSTRAFGGRLAILERAITERDAVAARGALRLLTATLEQEPVGELSVSRVVATLQGAPDELLWALDPFVQLAFGHGARFTRGALRRRFAELRRRALAARGPVERFRPLPRINVARTSRHDVAALRVMAESDPEGTPRPRPMTKRYSILDKLGIGGRGGQGALPEPTPRPRVAAYARPRPRFDPTFGEPTARALRARLAIGDWRPASKKLAEVRGEERTFYVLALGDWKTRPVVFDEWVEAEPGSPAAKLLRASHVIHWAWHEAGVLRGAAVAQDEVFRQRLEAAEADLEESAAADMAEPNAHALLTWAAVGLQRPIEATRHRFQDARSRAPGHRIAHRAMLTRLTERWGGSHERMFDFTREVGASAPEGSPLHALLARAHIERWYHGRAIEGAGDAADAYFESKEVRADVAEAFRLSLGSPKHTESRLSALDRNDFAFCFDLMGERGAARAIFDQIGPHTCLLPWGYRDADPTAAFVAARDRAEAL